MKKNKINKKYDLIIVGGGPIGSMIAYQVSKIKKDLNLKKVALLQQEPQSYRGIAYSNAGGSIRWHFDDKELKLATSKTKEFILKIKNKVNLDLIQDYYFFTHRGIFVPSLNINGKKLTNYLKEIASKQKVDIFSGTIFKSYKRHQNLYFVKTNKNVFLAKSLIFALGAKNKDFFKLPIEIEKRQLFVLNLKIDEKKFIPHTIFKIGKGIIFCFIKKINDENKLILGQEDLYQHSLVAKPENYFQKMVAQTAIGKILPFLKMAQVEKILWGFDVKNKKPFFYQLDENVWSVNCGSAIRSLVYVGEKALETIFKYAK